MRPDDNGFDYIIVGSGAGGAPLAARLVLNDARVRVLVIEAGASHTATDTPAREVSLVPGFHGLSTEHPVLSWEYFVKHYTSPPTGVDPKTHSQPGGPPEREGIFYPRSSGIGGCTVHNAMITIAGPDADWEDLADFLGDDTWRADVMRGYFERLEHNEYLRPPSPIPAGWWRRQWDNLRRVFGFPPDYARGKHGFYGWLHTSFTDFRLGLHDRQLKAVLGGALVQARRAGLDRGWTMVRRFLRGDVFESLDPNHAETQANSPEGVVSVPLAVCGKRTTIQQNAETPFVMRGRRSSPREFILEAQHKHPDRLEIWTDTLVTRVLFEAIPAGGSPRAIGVEFQKGARLYNATKKYSPDDPTPGDGPIDRVFVKPRGEVVLAGGSFNTPQLLMLSGIGDAGHLEEIAGKDHDPRLCTLRDSRSAPILDRYGRVIRHNLPGVGCNLQDRYEVSLISEMRQDLSILSGATFALPGGGSGPDRHLREWRTSGTGLYTSNGAVLGIFRRSKPDLDQPDLFIFGVPLPFRGYEVGYSQIGHIHNNFTWAILKGHTKNTDGRVRLRSSNPRTVPEINFHYFNELTCAGNGDSDPDLLAIAEGVNFVRGIFKHSRRYPLGLWSVGPHVGTEIHPGPKAVPPGDEQAIRDWIRRVAWGHHACGTCRMGPDGDVGAVLDARFRVRGVEGLRVVDASIFPKIPGYFIVANIYMASEKAADVLLEDAAYGRPDATAYPFELGELEAATVATRRENIRVKAGEPPLSPAVIDPGTRSWSDDVTGLALSGGGVRSATFNLGVLQAMARCRWLRRVDFLSTVSGGGYIGSFLGRWFDRLRPPSEWTGGGGPTASVPDRVERELNDPDSPALRWLRKSSNYIAPQGDGDASSDAAVAIRNFLSVHFVVGTLLFTVLGLLDWVRYRWFDPVFGLVLLGHPPAGSTGALAKWTAVLSAFASPWFLIAAFVVLFTAVPKIVAYWIVSEDRHGHFSGPPLVVLFLIVGGLLFKAWTSLDIAALVVAIALLTAFVHAELAWARGRDREAAIGRGTVETQRLRARNILTTEFGGSLRLIAAALVFAIVDTLGHAAQQYVGGSGAYVAAFAGAVAAMMALLPLVQRVAKFFTSDRNDPTGLARVVKDYVAAAVPAVVLFIVPLTIVAFAAHAAYDGGANVPRGLVLTLFLGLVSLVLVHPRAQTFVNRSSLAQIYAARLARAYLGATNPVRHRPEGSNVTEVVAGDDVASIRDYQPYKTGGPFHLINMTVDQTVEFTSQRGNRYRKGENVAVSNIGMSVGHQWHAAWQDGDAPAGPWIGRKRPTALVPIGHLRGNDHPLVDETGGPAQRAQMLSLRQWMAISGAAIGPAQGQSTQLGLALLFGLANLRTGYWWDCGISEPTRDGFPAVTFFRRIGHALADFFLTQRLILSEWIARFPGPWNQYWYLSDGGSFEVLGAYELIRRRLPRIIVSDASADPQYEMTGLTNLMRKARLDFNADIEPFTADECAKHVPHALQNRIGTLDDLRAAAAAKGTVSSKHAALFWVRYRSAPARPSVLLYIKASVTGDESADVLQYRATHPAFPHEPTSDQFFDEEQWESYRALGEHEMSLLCGHNGWLWAIPLEES